MTVHYATIYPAFRPAGDGLADCFRLPYTFFKHLCYESVCGYSLADDPKFFPTSQKVDEYYIRQTRAVKDRWFEIGCAELRIGAVVTFTVDSTGKVVSLDKIREINGHNDELVMIPDSHQVVRQISPRWVERTIKSSEVASGALKEFDRKYQAHRKQA